MKPFLLSFFLLISTLVPTFVYAGSKVAFLEEYDEKGNLIEYEPGSRFGHSAIQIGDKWLQSYPEEGVRLITWRQLQARGKVVAVLEIPVTLTMEEAKPFLGKPFDFDYDWDDKAFYCSELLGKLLKIPPQPMHFNHAVWPKWYWDKEGSPGLSPDGIYQYLKTKYSL